MGASASGAEIVCSAVPGRRGGTSYLMPSELQSALYGAVQILLTG